MFTPQQWLLYLCIWMHMHIVWSVRLLPPYNHAKTFQEDLSIHVFAWRRSRSLARLLKSLESAWKPKGMTISITFHVDFDYNPKITSIIDSFSWALGSKRVHLRTHRYGLPHNILHSWFPTSSHQYALFLEDDVEVSPYFLLWTRYCMKMMSKDHNMIGCSFYTPIVDEIGPAPNAWSPPKWSPLRELGPQSCFHFQLPCSWGAVYSSRTWMPFVQYYSLRFWMESAPDAPNSRTIEWFKSWKRHLIDLMLEHRFFLLYPFSGKNHTSFSTNYFEKGVHSVPLGQEPVYHDSLKTFDHRFTVPLIKDQSWATKIVDDCEKLERPPIFNLYHKRVNDYDGLEVSMKELWLIGNFKELIRHSDAIRSLLEIDLA